MISRTFQLFSGVGPWREKDLWARGILTWDDFPAEGGPVAMSARLDAQARARIAEAREALEKKDLTALARLVPPREHWRLYPAFAERAAFFDVETPGPDEPQPTVASVLDRRGLRVFIRDRNMDLLPAALAESEIWVTFNGSCFDLPVLERSFAEFQPPVVHLDLRVFCRRVGWPGGLKQVEDRLGMNRPRHLRGVGGLDAAALWRFYLRTGEVDALRLLVEYNLYDAFGLRTVLEAGFNRATELLALDEEPRLAVFERGDVLYDVSRILLELGPLERDLEVMARLRPQDRQLNEEFAAE